MKVRKCSDDTATKSKNSVSQKGAVSVCFMEFLHVKDPACLSKTVIVVRSLVPGGSAYQVKRLKTTTHNAYTCTHVQNNLNLSVFYISPLVEDLAFIKVICLNMLRMFILYYLSYHHILGHKITKSGLCCMGLGMTHVMYSDSFLYCVNAICIM